MESTTLRSIPVGPVVGIKKSNPKSPDFGLRNKKQKMHWLFSPPSIDDLVRLLKAWRFWSVGALVGALLGAAIYYMAPPPYRAQATVLVDFNLEQAWPQETD